MTETAIFVADTHLQERAWANRPIEGDAKFAFEQIVDAAIERNLNIVGAGDLLDRHVNTAETAVFLYQQLRRLGQNNLIFYFVQGQHDMSATPWFHGAPNTCHLHRRQTQVRGMSLYGLDYLPAGELQQALDSVPEADVLVAHQVWFDLMGEIGAPQGSFADLPGHIRHMVTGDYHVTRQVQAKNRAGQTVQVLSPGSTCMQSIDEPADKYFFVASLSDGKLTYEQVPLRTRLFELLEVATEDALDATIDRLPALLDELWDKTAGYPEEIRKPLVRVVYPHSLTGAAGRITRAADGRAHLFWRELSPAESEMQDDGQRKAARVAVSGQLTLESRLEQYLQETGRSKLKDECQRLLQAPDIRQELVNMRAAALSESR